MRNVEIVALVPEDEARTLMLELADDPRVEAVHIDLGDSKYLVPSRAEVSQPGSGA